MSNTILIKRSGTASAQPSAANLSLGELAINYTDGNLFYKNNGGTVTVIASNQFLSVTGNVTANNGMFTTIVNTASFTGGIVSVTGNITGNYILGNGSQLTGIDATSIQNGTSNVRVVSSGGNVTVGVGGTSNVAVFATTGEYITGLVSVTGNVIANNGMFTNIVNVASHTGGLVSVTGNVTANNGIFTTTVNTASFTGGLVSVSGNIIGGNISTVGNINGANIVATTLSATGNVVANNVLATTIVNAASYTGTTVSVSGNITGGNISVGTGTSTAGSYSASGNVTANNGMFTNIVNVASHTGTIVSVTGNITAGNISTAGNVNGANLVATTLSATGNMLAGTISTAGNITGANVNTNNIVGTALAIKSTGDLTLSPTGNVSLSSRWINNLADPVQDQDAATKYYVDTVAQGLHVHPAANLATTSDLATWLGIPSGNVTYTQPGPQGVGATLTFVGNSLQRLDGVNVTANMRLLIKNQSNAVTNGAYTITSNLFVITRAADMNNDVELAGGDFLFVNSGTVNGDTSWVQTTDNVVIGTSNIVFTQFSGAGTYSANTSAGLSLNGTVFNAKVDGNSNPTTAFDANGNIYVPAGAAFTTPNIGAAIGTSLSVTGNITANNGMFTNVVNVASHTGSVVSVTGNVTANNGIFTNIVNVASHTGAVVSVSGNITGGNLTTAGTGNIGTLIVTTLANITASTISTSSITGAVIVAGGLGVAGNIYGGALYDNGTAVLTINSTVDGGTY